MDIIALLTKLITFRTTADRTAELDRAIGFIKNILGKKGIWTQTLVMLGAKRPVLYACTQKTKRPALLLVPHLDVVEGADQQFVPRRKGQWLWGRGVGDCKCNVAVSIQALLEFAGSGRSLGAFFITDEETGGATTKWLLQKGFVAQRALILDGNQDIVFRQKGILNLKVTAKGKSAHGAELWEGENAIEKLMASYAKIQRLFPATTPKNRWKETVNLGIMRGGDVINKVPDYAEMRLNIRLTEKADYRKIIRKIQQVPGVHRVEVLGYHRFFYVDPKSHYVREYKRIMEKSMQVKFPVDSMHGATDVHNFAGYKTELIISGCGGGKGAHAEDERIHLPHVLAFEKALKEYIRQTV